MKQTRMGVRLALAIGISGAVVAAAGFRGPNRRYEPGGPGRRGVDHLVAERGGAGELERAPPACPPGDLAFGASGIEWGELQLRGSSEAWRTRVVVVRLDPAQG